MQQLQTYTLQPIALPPLSENPLVSVLVANYNYARYISETLDSVLSQTYQNFEVIVCDDGSKDNSCEIIETYVQKDSRIKLISKANGGVATALNTTYRESKGEIICLLDADDVWMNTKLEKVVDLFKSDSKNGFAIHNVIQIDGQGNLLKSTSMFKRLASGWMGEFALENGGFVYNIPPASALSIRREIGDIIFPLNESFRTNADSLIFRFAPFITVIGAVPVILSKFRIHGANTTTQASVTVDSMKKSKVVFERIHQEQKKFLKNIYGTEVAQRLTDLEASVVVCHDNYLLARFENAPKTERENVHQQLINHPNLDVMGVPQQILFQWGEHLPKPIFEMFFHQVYGSSPLKRLAKWLIGLRHAQNPAQKLF